MRPRSIKGRKTPLITTMTSRLMTATNRTITTTNSRPFPKPAAATVAHYGKMTRTMAPAIESEKVMFEIYRELSFNRRYRVVYFTELDDHNRDGETTDSMRGN